MREIFMGSDVSKGYCDFVILDQNEKVLLDNFQLDDTYSGHKYLTSVIENLFEKYSDISLYVGFESTGSYENNWFSFFSDQLDRYNIKLVRFNPTGIYHHAKSVYKNVTTDKESARSIAEYLIHNKNKIRFNEDPRDIDLRNKWSFIRVLTKQKTQLKNQLSKHLYLSHPQLLSYMNGDTPKWFIKLILKYPTARRLSGASVKSISKIPYVSETRAIKLIEEAKLSVASSNTKSAELLIKLVVKQILSIENIIKEQKKTLLESVKSEEVELLKSITGIADYTACGLMISIGRIQRFSSKKKLVSFWGLNPKFKESGDKTSGVRMSKAGRKEARYLLFNAAKSAINNNSWLNELYEKHLKNGKSKLSAIGIIMHKLARIIYGMLKNKTKFDSDIDKNNVMQYTQKEVRPIQNRKRRFQSYDSKAPISLKHRKKRNFDVQKKDLKQAESQNDNIIVCEIITPANENLL